MFLQSAEKHWYQISQTKKSPCSMIYFCGSRNIYICGHWELHSWKHVGDSLCIDFLSIMDILIFIFTENFFHSLELSFSILTRKTTFFEAKQLLYLESMLNINCLYFKL